MVGSEGIPLGVGDISKSGGGSFQPDHNEHQNGLDLDVRYIRDDRSEEGVLASNTAYDPADSQDLVDLFFQYGAVSILVNLNSGITGSGVTQRSDHNDHFHVRFPDPDGTTN